MKRQKASRKVAKPLPVNLPLPHDANQLFRVMHERCKDENGRFKYLPRSVVNGIPLPENLGEVADDIGREDSEFFNKLLMWCSTSLPQEDIERLGGMIADSVRKGFVLALLRYQDDLKHVPEARAVLEANRRNARKGGEARRQEAEPRRQQARRLDRELRKEGGLMKKKTYRIQRIAAEMRVDTRTVERYLAPKK